jgi:hypothetical protein
MLYKNNMACPRLCQRSLYRYARPIGPAFLFPAVLQHWGVLVPASVLKAKKQRSGWNSGTTPARTNFAWSTSWTKVTYRVTGCIFSYFLDVQLPRFACVLLLFVALLFVFQYLNYREEEESLLLSLCAFFFALYLFNVTVFSAGMSMLR